MGDGLIESSLAGQSEAEIVVGPSNLGIGSQPS